MTADKNDNHPHPRQHATLIQHGTILDSIIEQAKTRGHHAFIFTGTKGIGKATTAYALARRLFAGADEAPLIAAGSHPDLLTIEPDTEKISKIITVDQIRGIRQFLHHRPAKGGWRMVIIDSLDAVNINGANAMLKILEEPPDHALIVLIHHQGRPILPVIRSRSIIVPFKPLAASAMGDLMHQIFPGVDAAWLNTALPIADGAPGKMLVFADEGVVELYTEVCAVLASPKPSLAKLESLASQLGAAGGAKRGRRIAAFWLFDRLMGRVVDCVVNSDRKINPPEDKTAEDETVEALAQRIPLHRLADLHQKLVADCDEAERLNLNQSIIFFNLMYNLAY